MICYFCGFADTHVKDSRPSEDGSTIKRRRHCDQCGAKFTTFERIEIRELKIIKRNGDIRLFDASKITRSIEVATRKRPINQEKIETIISNIMKKISQYYDCEVESRVVGKMVMDELADLDHVSCVRYASVYMDFAKASDFATFIKNLDRGPNEQ